VRSIYTVLPAFLLLGSGCAAAVDGTSQDDIDGSETVVAQPSELLIGGRRFVPVSSLTESELKVLHDPQLWQPPQTVEKLATNLRRHMLHMEHGEYVEAEPNFELARISLGLQPSPIEGDQGGGSEPNIGRVITSDGDQRFTGCTNCYPGTAVAMFESGGSGAMISRNSDFAVYTAGHVVYNNANETGSDGWYCQNGTKQANLANCSPHARWAFGGNGGTWFRNFTICGFRFVPNGWANMPAGTSTTGAVRWDYAVQNLEGCVSGTGALGWSQWGDNDLNSTTLFSSGYPTYFTCPANTSGVSNAAGGDCAASGSQGVVQLVPTNLSRPFTAGNLFFSNAGSKVGHGTGFWNMNLDSTTGMSGGSAMYSSNGVWVSVGVVSRGSSSGRTYYNRMTTEVINFIFQ
jgi:hypothetical protein